VMDGYEATRRIRELERSTRRARLPIVGLTANAMKGDRQVVIDAGMDEYLSKPYTRAQLIGLLWSLVTGMSGDREDKYGAVAVPDGGTETVDPEAIENIRKLQQPNKPDILRKVIDHYLETAPQLIGDLQKSIDDNRPDDARMTAHTLKSSSAMLGAITLSRLFAEIEAAARGGKLQDVLPVTGNIVSIYREVAEQLNGLIHGKNEHENSGYISKSG